jgi:hypothetical protein
MNTGLSRRGLAVIGGVAGLVLFGVMLHVVSPATILAGARRVGTGFLLLLLLAGLRLAARAAAWTACAGGPRRLPLTATFNACVVGESAGNLTPLGLAASEPAKVLWVRHHLGTMESAASLAAETLVYSLAVAVMLVAGSLIWTVTLAPAAVTRTIPLGLVAVTGLAALTWAIGRHREGPLARALRWIESRDQNWPRLGTVGRGLRRTAEMLRNLISHQPATLGIVALLQVLFQAAAVGEVWLTLALLGVSHVTVLQAFLLEYANRVVTVAFKFVPMRLGVDELASGAMASLLGSGGTVGVTLAVIRKARVLCWSAVGLGLVAVRATATRARPGSSEVMVERVDSATW